MAEHQDRAPNRGSTRYTITADDIELLRVNGVSVDDIAHSVKVAEKALEQKH